jgi:hypothetical protein
MPGPPWVLEETALTQGGVARQIVSAVCTRMRTRYRATAASSVSGIRRPVNIYVASNPPVERARQTASVAVNVGGRAAHRPVMRTDGSGQGQRESMARLS